MIFILIKNLTIFFTRIAVKKQFLYHQIASAYRNIVTACHITLSLIAKMLIFL